MNLKRNISNKLQASSSSIAKEIVYAIVMVTGIALTGYGIYLQDLAIVISGAALITASVIGIVMSMQTSKIARNIYDRFDGIEDTLKSNHKEAMNNHRETMSVLNRIVDVLEEIKTELKELKTELKELKTELKELRKETKE